MHELITIQGVGLETSTQELMQARFEPLFAQAEKWKLHAASIVVTDTSQKAEMAMARTARLALREVRLSAERTRKELKEESLRYGQAVQSVYNTLEGLVKPLEEYLETQERFAEIQEAARKAELRAKRESELRPLAAFVPSGLDLAGMSTEDYEKILAGATLQAQEKVEADRLAEVARIEKEKAEAEEKQRVQAENERLRAEAREREAAAAIERATAETKIREEREKVAQLQAEAEAKQKAENEEKQRVEREKVEAEAQRNAAPDAEKLEVLRLAIIGIALPNMDGAKGKKTLAAVQRMLQEAANFIQQETK